MGSQEQLSSSFRDPNGFIFKTNGELYRQINKSYQDSYDHLMSSGLYEELVGLDLLIPHSETGYEEVNSHADQAGAYKVIKPEIIPYISYPFEWSFSQLKDAALCTIRVQLLALKYGMVLKDASAYNIQFRQASPIFIDTLSFDLYQEGEAWVAYKQFCQHFIGPLALMMYCDERLSQLFRVYMDGLPLDLVSRLLPKKTWFKYSLLSHVHLHAKTQAHYANMAEDSSGGKKIQSRKISAFAFEALIKSIESCVVKMHWHLSDTEWGDYYSATNYEDLAMLHKEELITEYISQLPDRPGLAHDLGANNGHFSRIVASLGIKVISQDIDPTAVEKNYLHVKSSSETNILPLVLDLTNPSSDMGWQLQERDSLLRRCHDSFVLALALIHHLAISNNVPLEKVAEFFASLASILIIEFVPKQDSQVQRLLATREDIFPDYNKQGFEKAFSQYFTITRSEVIVDSERTLYLLYRVG